MASFFRRKTEPEALEAALSYAYHDHDVERARASIAKASNLNVHLPSGGTPLTMVMSSWRLRQLVGAMLKLGADPNYPTREGVPPLVAAIREGDSSIVQLLVDAGADVTRKEKDGSTPLIHAAGSYTANSLVKTLLKKDNDVNAQNDKGDTALHCAARRGDAETVLRLLAAGADATIANADGKTPPQLVKDFPALEDVLRNTQPGARAQAAQEGWKLSAQDEVARVFTSPAIGYRVTEVFNFSSRVYTKVMRNIETGAESQAVKSFSDIGEGGLVEKAHAALEDLGGEARDHGVIKKKLQKPGVRPEPG